MSFSPDIRRFLRFHRVQPSGSASSDIEVIQLNPQKIAAPAAYFDMQYAPPDRDNRSRRYSQSLEVTYPVSQTHIPELYPVSDAPEPSKKEEYDAEFDKIFVELAIENLLNNGAIDNEAEDLSPIDTWINNMPENEMTEPEFGDLMRDIAGDSTADAVPELDASLFDDAQYDPLFTEQSLDSILDGDSMSDMSDLENILDEYTPDDILEADDPSEMDPDPMPEPMETISHIM